MPDAGDILSQRLRQTVSRACDVGNSAGHVDPAIYSLQHYLGPAALVGSNQHLSLIDLLTPIGQASKRITLQDSPRHPC